MWMGFECITQSCQSLALVCFSRGRVLLTLSADIGRILSKVHEVQAEGEINFLSSVRIAQVCYSRWFLRFSIVVYMMTI